MSAQNSELSRSEKGQNSMEENVLAKLPSMELEADEPTAEVAPLQEGDRNVEMKAEEKQEEEDDDEMRAEEKQEEGEEEEDRFKLLASTLVVNLTTTEEESKLEDEEEEGFKTPTSEEHKIPVMLECPPAPKRPRLSPPPTQREGGCRWINILPEAGIGDFFSACFSLLCDVCRAHNRRRDGTE